LFSLVDLAQDTNQWVAEYLRNWVKELVQTFGFDGLRIDTLQYVPKGFWPGYVEAAGVFQFGEITKDDCNYTGDY